MNVWSREQKRRMSVWSREQKRRFKLLNNFFPYITKYQCQGQKAAKRIEHWDDAQNAFMFASNL